MAVTGALYSHFPENLGGGDTSGEAPMDLLSDTLKIMMTTSTNSISQTADTVKADITNEVSGTGYTAGGDTLASKTWGTSSLVTTFDAADTTWAAATITNAAQAHLYDDTATSPADPLILYFDFGGNQSTSGTNFVLQYNASGLYTVTVT